MAAGLHKPDGLDTLTHKNLVPVFNDLKLEDLTGIARAFGLRLRQCGIYTPLDFLMAREDVLKKRVFRSVCGTYWYQRLRGYEVDDYQTKLGMVGRQWVVHKPTHEEEYLRSCLHYLTETVAIKLRHRNREARGVCVWMGFCEGGGFHEKKMYQTACYTNDEIWRRVYNLFAHRPKLMRVKIMGIYLYQLEPSRRDQLSMLDDIAKAERITAAVDKVNDFYGTFTVHSADALIGKQFIKQKVPFGGTEYFKLLLKRG
jgi:DNA polymerase-4